MPAALGISAVVPALIQPLLMLGGLYLCFEGVEKLAHPLLHRADDNQTRQEERLKVLTDPALDVVAYERDKIKGAVRTDFVLSAEIIVISLGTVATATLTEQFAVLAGIAVIMTVVMVVMIIMVRFFVLDRSFLNENVNICLYTLLFLQCHCARYL